MTEHNRSAARISFYENSENESFRTELHLIAELLEEILTLLRSNATSNNGIISEEPSSSSNEAMTIKEAAALLKISLPTMYEFAHSGKVHCLTIGRRILVSRSSIMALLMEGK